VTGWGAEEDRRKSEEAGFNRHIVTPVDPTSLMMLLSDLTSTNKMCERGASAPC
jgi:hypothetical protein